MDGVPIILKRAFLARINDRVQRAVTRHAVDTRYDFVGDDCHLVIIYSDGSEETFKGLDCAA